MSEADIYSIVPNVESVDETKKNTLKDFLQRDPGTFYSARYLSGQCGFTESATSVELRNAVTKLIEIDECPIVAGAKGFSWATCSNMVKFYAEQLKFRQFGLQRRIDAVTRIYNIMDNKQLSK